MDEKKKRRSPSDKSHYYKPRVTKTIADSPIARARIMRGMTQAQLGAALSEPVTGMTIARYESRQRDIKVSTLQEIAAVLGVDVTELI